ncbi:MAG: hypothetical protein JXR80_00365 [Deltaproteobacteria bacterium]|nr:hypothetical protein [Deltaproteobacteria bacterium]
MKTGKTTEEKDSLKNLLHDFNLGLNQETETAKEKQTQVPQAADISLPQLLVEAFQSGLKEKANDCDCSEECAKTPQDSRPEPHACRGCHHHV